MNNKRIALTTGDSNGIGLEVTLKALAKLGPQKGIQFLIWREDSAYASKEIKKLDKKFKRITVESLSEALKIHGNYLIDIASDLSPAHWVEETAKACMKNQLQGMATAPLSKVTIKKAGFKDLGHTDILKRVSGVKKVHMGFIGDKFAVVLATGHIPVMQITKHLSFSSLTDAILHADQMRKLLPPAKKNKPIGVLGLNPHAGEEGLIGKEELMLFPELAGWGKENKVPLKGPLVPDAAFFPQNWDKYSVYVALYHDQGLIPFKMTHGQDSGVHMTLGIPFVRTSVDHGTATDIFGKNKANPSSMSDAIRWAVKFARLKA